MLGRKSLSITQKLVLLVTAALVVPIVVGVFALQDQNTLSAVAEDRIVLEQANAALHHLDTRESELKVSAHRALVESDVAAIERDLVEDDATIKGIVARLQALRLPAALKAEIDAVEPDVTAFTAFVAAFLRDARLDPAATQARVGEIDERNHVIDDKLGAIHEMLDAASTQRLQQEAAVSAASDRGRRIVTVFLALGLGLFVTLGVLVIRGISGPLRRIKLVLESAAKADPTATAPDGKRKMRVGGDGSGEIGALGRAFDEMLDALEAQATELHQNQASREDQIRMIHSQQRTADEQSRQRVQQVVEETSAGVIDELRAVVEQVDVVRNAAGTIDERVAAAGDATTKLVTHAHEANLLVDTLGTSLHQVEGIVRIITGVAAQTRLLSLNATIEAHRAGDAGRGFTVVADEVKNLAASTAASTEEITSTIGTLERDATAMSEALVVIADRVTDINTTTSHIQEFTGRQQATVEELDRRVTDMIGRIEAMSSVTASAERRTAPRVPITVPATLRLGPTTYPVTVINLSRGGMRCSLGGAQPPPSDATVSIELQLMDTALNLQGTVRSTTPTGEVGIECSDTSSAAAKSLETYLGSG